MAFSRRHSKVWKEAQELKSINQIEDYASGKRQLPEGNGWKNYSHGRIRTKKAGKIYYRSSWEKAFVEILEASSLVQEFMVAPFSIPYKLQGKKRNYFPDFLIELTDGRKFLVELKGVFGDTDQTKAKVKAAKKFCKVEGIEFKMFLEKVNSISEVIN